MTSMLLIARYAWVLMTRKRPPEGGRCRLLGWSAFGRAVAGRDVLLLGVLRRVLLDLGAHQLAVGLHPVGDHLPLGAVPLLELHQPRALVVEARDLDGRHQPRRAELLQALVVDVQVLDAPAHLLAGDRLALAELRLREADR